MTSLPAFARLRELKGALETAVRVIKELAVNQSLSRLAAQDPEGWNFLLDSFAAGMEPGELGSIRQILAALEDALED
jgi:hypothetical protein